MKINITHYYYWAMSVIFVVHFCCYADSLYKPVVLVHGILTNDSTISDLGDHIKQVHPGTKVYITNQFGGLWSLEPMWHQVKKIGAEIMQICALHPEGIHLLGYSQGGLIARGVLELFPDHNVQHFISLSSPQAGEYGIKFLHIFYPKLALKEAYELFYSHLGQLTSVGNYWNDPHHQQLYYRYNSFLPQINNEVEECGGESGNTGNDVEPCRDKYKRGVTKLRHLVLIGGPDDGVISPWQSSHFGYYDNNEKVLDMKNQTIYKDDLFGLKTLDTSGRLTTYSVPGVAHPDWHRNISVIDKYIIPWLS